MTSLDRFYPRLAGRIAALRGAIRSTPSIGIRGQWVRDMPAEAMRLGDPLWALGYRTQHNRYVRRGAFPAFHVSEGVSTAAAEVFGIAPTPAPVLGIPPTSRLVLLVDVVVERVLDLVDPAVRGHVGISEHEITRLPDWSVLDAWERPLQYELTQCIGELAHRAGCDGVRYPAVRRIGGMNLVVFTRRLARTGGSLAASDPFTGASHTIP